MISSSIGLSGEYNLVINKADGTSVETGWFKNLITDVGLDQIGQGVGSLWNNCFIGTGTTAPAVTQTSLVSRTNTTGSYTNTSGTLTAPTYGGWRQHEYRFSAGSVVGNMSEIGVGRNSDGTNIFSRALISTYDGTTFTPQALTITSSDQLTVFYRIYITLPLTDVSGTFDLSGVTYSYTSRICSALNTTPPDGGLPIYQACYAYPAAFTLHPITEEQTSWGGNFLSDNSWFTNPAYVNGSRTYSRMLVIPNTHGGASGGIGGFGLWHYGSAVRSQIAITPAIPKDLTNTLTIGFQISWDRV